MKSRRNKEALVILVVSLSRYLLLWWFFVGICRVLRPWVNLENRDHLGQHCADATLNYVAYRPATYPTRNSSFNGNSIPGHNINGALYLVRYKGFFHNSFLCKNCRKTTALSPVFVPPSKTPSALKQKRFSSVLHHKSLPAPDCEVDRSATEKNINRQETRNTKMYAQVPTTNDPATAPMVAIGR